MKEILNAILGDGQLIKGNDPFKPILNKLVGKDLAYRWDPLHLFNRAHIKARGAICKNEMKTVTVSSTSVEHEDYDWDEIVKFEEIDGTGSGYENTDNVMEIVRQLIKYIKKSKSVSNRNKIYRTPSIHSWTFQETKRCIICQCLDLQCY